MPTSFRPLEGALAELTSVKTALSTTAKCRLYQGPWVPTPINVGADFAAHVATYFGYADATIASWSGPYVAGGGTGYFIAGPQEWFPYTGSSGVASNNIYGYWIEDVAAVVHRTEAFDTPVAMNGPNQVCPVVPMIIYGTGG